MSIAFVFPGQGSQSVGMLAELASEGTQINDRLRQASEIIDEDLVELVNSGPPERLNQTEITQPALLASSVGLYDMFLERGGVSPDCVSGHSVGEYSALVAANALGFDDGVRIVHERGRLMQHAVPIGEGSMSAILGLDNESVAKICQEIQGTVAPANFNAPGQVVIAGHTESVTAAGDACKAAGARRVLPLDVSVPSHCSLMEPAAEGLSGLLESILVERPSVPVYQNVDGSPVVEPKQIRENLIAQVKVPVLWTQCILTMIKDGATNFYECGPGKVLAGLMRRIDRSASVVALSDHVAFNAALSEE